MHEIELKFQVPPDRRRSVDAAVAGRAAAPRTRLQAAYFDTASRALARAGLALRIRREGRRWVQTLKGLGDDGITRAEHNVVLTASHQADWPADPARHAGTAVGERLAAVLHEAGEPLSLVFRTDILRRTRRVRTPRGTVELAFDDGHINAGGQRLAVCELEIELVSGSPLAVIETARRWVLPHGLWLDTRSKAERGDMMARGETMAPPRKAASVALSDEMPLCEGRRLAVLSCLEQIAVNGSQVASGRFDDEHVHQLRIGLRRLNTALRLFRDDASPETADVLCPMASSLFRQLAAARDRAAIGKPLESALSAALAAAGLGMRAPQLPVQSGEEDPVASMRGTSAQTLLLELYALTQARPDPTPVMPDLRDVVGQQILHWHRKLKADVKRFDALDDLAHHTMRKRTKSLRYGTEFAAGLFKRKEVEHYLKRLRRLQDHLGLLVDTTVALDAFRGHAEQDPRASFALGWLASRKQLLLRKSRKPLDAFSGSHRFWKR